MTRSKWYRRRGRCMDVAGRGARGITPADLITPVHLVGRAVPVTPADPVGRAELPELVGRAHPVARVDLPELVDPVGRVELPEPAGRADLADQAELGRPAEADPAEADSAGVASAAVALAEAVASAAVAVASEAAVAEAAAAADSSLLAAGAPSSPGVTGISAQRPNRRLPSCRPRNRIVSHPSIGAGSSPSLITVQSGGTRDFRRDLSQSF